MKDLWLGWVHTQKLFGYATKMDTEQNGTGDIPAHHNALNFGITAPTTDSALSFLTRPPPPQIVLHTFGICNLGKNET